MNDKDLTESELDQLISNDMQCISLMMLSAKKYSLLTEVIYSYGLAMASHGNVPRAVNQALMEWDI